jgi:hypothetical protein
MTFLFIKRLNDTFEENAEILIKQGKVRKKYMKTKLGMIFFIPKEARWA